MNYLNLMKSRHSVRQYTEEKIEGEALLSLKEACSNAEKESGLKFALCLNETEAFNCKLSRKLGFKNAFNYIAVIGKKTEENEINTGYFGADIVLKAQAAGLNTCFVLMTYDKKKVPCKLGKNEKILCVIVVGHGETSGVPHINCSIDKLCDFRGDMPHWFMNGMDGAMLAPTARNKQKFCLILRNGNQVKLVKRGRGNQNVTLGIVKYFFEKTAGKENFIYV